MALYAWSLISKILSIVPVHLYKAPRSRYFPLGLRRCWHFLFKYLEFLNTSLFKSDSLSAFTILGVQLAELDPVMAPRIKGAHQTNAASQRIKTGLL
jgi:hypothetical protein